MYKLCDAICQQPRHLATDIVKNRIMKNCFAERLKDLRTEKELSQAELSKKLNGKITKSAISRWELKKRVPNLDAVIMLADFFDVSIDYLAGRID